MIYSLNPKVNAELVQIRLKLEEAREVFRANMIALDQTEASIAEALISVFQE